MPTTTIGPFTVTHIAGVVKMLTEGDEMIVGSAACRLALAAATDIDRLRAALDVATTGRASAAEGYRDVIREVSEDRERIRAELAASKEEIERLRATKETP